MAKGETAKTNQMLQSQRDSQAATYNPIIAQQGTQANTANANNDQTYNDLYSGYSAMANGQGLNGAAAGGGGGVSYQAPQYTTTDYTQSKGVYDNAINNGLVDDPSLARMRGAGVYDDFAKTGGYSDQDIANLRSRASSATPAFYANVTRGVDQQARVSGGGGLAANALRANLARQNAQQGSSARLDAELGLKSAINTNKLAGAEGASTSELNAQGLITGNKKWGTEGVKSIAEQQAAEANRQAEANAAAANSSASSASDAARYADQLRAAGLGGLSDLRGQELQAGQSATGNQLAAANALYGIDNDQLQMRYGAQGNNTSGWEKGAGIAVGALGAMTGVGAIGSIAKAVTKK